MWHHGAQKVPGFKKNDRASIICKNITPVKVENTRI
jgi:hypothetical protein